MYTWLEGIKEKKQQEALIFWLQGIISFKFAEG